MASKTLYTLAVPRDAQTSTRSELQRNLSKQGVLQSDVAAVEAVSLDPGQQILQGQYRGRYSDLMAAEFEELFDASGIEAVPFYSRSDRTQTDGYYTLENTTVQPLDPRAADVSQFDGVLTRVGSRTSHWRAVRTSPVPATNDFGTGTGAWVGVPERAQKVRWFDPVGGTIEAATVQETVPAEVQNVARYDVTEPTFSEPTLLYDLPYQYEGATDLRVWDDSNRSRFEPPDNDTVGSVTVGSATVGGRGIPRWQAVFRTDHEYQGTTLVENAILRLEFDEERGHLRASRWSGSVGDYATVHLGGSDWHLFDVDLTHIGLDHVDAQVEFESPSGGFFNLNMSLKRGYRNALWTVPDNESGPTPSGLITRLDPIAHPSDTDPNATQDVIRRKEVRR